MAKLGGLPSLSRVELRTQNFYFGFQVVQVFLVTTLTSAASAAVTQIIMKPASALDLLATNLPKASNFYISYFILQGLIISSGALLQIVGLILARVLGKFLDSTPRKMYNRWSRLSGLGWGTVFPVYTNLCVIGMHTLSICTKQANLLLSHYLFMHRSSCPWVRHHRSLLDLFCIQIQPTLCLQRRY